WTVDQSDEELMLKLQTAGVPAGRIGNPEDQMEKDPQLKARQFYVEREHPEVGKYRPPRQPCLLSKTPSETKRAPLLGEHNDTVFKEILGLEESEIDELIIEEIIQ
ncbi:MAG: CoA transferase, partial [Proteobacteria bacterium]|nr:CoA transferase [Pseudomonadota bacterium]